MNDIARQAIWNSIRELADIVVAKDVAALEKRLYIPVGWPEPQETAQAIVSMIENHYARLIPLPAEPTDRFSTDTFDDWPLPETADPRFKEKVPGTMFFIAEAFLWEQPGREGDLVMNIEGFIEQGKPVPFLKDLYHT